MSDINTTPVDLANLGTTSTDDLNQALDAQPETVKVEAEPEAPEVEPPVKKLFNDGLDYMDYTDEDGYARMYNPHGSFQGDLDQFGHRTMVTGLDKGFTLTGFEDTYNRSQEAQGIWEKSLNGTVRLAGDIGTHVVSGLAMIPGVFHGLAQGDVTAVYDNAFQRGLDSKREEFHDYFQIKRGGDQGVAKQVSNFVFEDFFGAAAFVLGAVATESALTALSAVTLGGAAPAQAVATVGLAAKGARVFKSVMSGGKAVMSGKYIDDAVKGFNTLAANATRAKAGKGIMQAGLQAARAGKLNAGAKVGRQLLTGAGMEAGVEARGMADAAQRNHKVQYEEEYGRGTYTEEMASEFRQTISTEMDTAFFLNLGLVGISNMLMFPKIFGASMKSGMKTVRTVPKSSLSNAARKRAAKSYGVTEAALPELLDVSRGLRWGRNLRRTKLLRRGLYEGFVEEGGQGTITRTGENYIAEKYNPVNTEQTANFTQAFLEGAEGSYTTAGGLKEIGMGFLLGILGVPNILRMKSNKADGTEYTPWMMGGVQAQRDEMAAKDNAVDNILNLHKKHGNVASFMEAEFQNMNIQKGLAVQSEKAFIDNDFKQAKDIEADQIFSHATSKIVTGRFNDAIQESKEILDEMSPAEFRESLGPEGDNMSDSEVRSRKLEVHDSYVQKMNRVKESFDAAGQIYKGDNPDIHTGVANLMYNLKDRDVREKYIADSIAKKLEYLNGDQVLESSRMIDELKLTKSDITEMTALDTKIKRMEKQLKTKLERRIIKNVDPVKAAKREEDLSRLQEDLLDAKDAQDALQQSLASRSKIEGEYEFDFVDQVEKFKALIEMNRALEAVGEKVLTVDQTSLNEDVRDLLEVTKDRTQMIAAYNALIEPGGYDKFLGRLRGTIKSMHITPAELKKEYEAAAYEKRVKEEEELEEKVQQAATEENIQSDLDEEEIIVDDASVYSDLNPNDLEDPAAPVDPLASADLDPGMGPDGEIITPVTPPLDPAPVVESKLPEDILRDLDGMNAAIAKMLAFRGAERDQAAILAVRAVWNIEEQLPSYQQILSNTPADVQMFESLLGIIKEQKTFLKEQGYASVSKMNGEVFTKKDLFFAPKTKFNETPDLKPGEEIVDFTSDPGVTFEGKLIANPIYVVDRGAAMRKDPVKVVNDPSSAKYEFQFKLDDPRLTGKFNPATPGAENVLVNGIKKGDKVTLQRGVYAGSVDIMYKGEKIAYITKYEVEQMSADIQDIASIATRERTLEVTVASLSPTSKGGTLVKDRVDEYVKETLSLDSRDVDNTASVVDTVNDLDEVQQLLFVLPGDGVGEDLQDAIEGATTPLAKPGEFDSPNMDTSGRHYMVIKDHKTQEPVWVSLEGEKLGEAEAKFIYQAAKIVDAYNGTRTLEDIGMTVESFEKSIKTLQGLGLNLEGNWNNMVGMADPIPLALRIKNNTEFAKLVTLLTGYDLYSSSSEYREPTHLAKTHGVNIDVFTTPAKNNQEARIEFTVFDLDGTAPGEIKTLRSNEVDPGVKEKAILNALGRLRKSATTLGRDMHTFNPEKEWPLIIKVNKEGNELVTGHNVPYKEWVLNRLRTNQRAPIKAQDKNGNPVLVAKGFNDTITLDLGDEVEETPTAAAPQSKSVEEEKEVARIKAENQAYTDAGVDLDVVFLPLKENQSVESINARRAEELKALEEEQGRAVMSAQEDGINLLQPESQEEEEEWAEKGHYFEVQIAQLHAKYNAEIDELPTANEVSGTKSNSTLGNLIEAWLATPEGSLGNQTVDESASRFAKEYQKRNSLIEGKAINDIEGSDIFKVINQGLTTFISVKAEINKQTSHGLGSTPAPLGIATQQPSGARTISYTPKGKKTQTYTIKGSKIFNASNVEVFKTDSVDRNKIFANLAVQEKRAQVVEYRGTKYVVNNRNQIISATTGKLMQWAENDGNRKAILSLVTQPISVGKPRVLSSGSQTALDRLTEGIEGTYEELEEAAQMDHTTSEDFESLRNSLAIMEAEWEKITGLKYPNTQPSQPIDDSVPQIITPSAVSIGENMARAGKLYGVEGMSVRQVAATVNIMKGLASHELLINSMTTGSFSVEASELDTKVRKKFEDRLKVLKALEAEESTPQLLVQIKHHQLVLEPTRFRKLILLSFLDILRNSQGTVQSMQGKTIGEVLNEVIATSPSATEEEINEDEIVKAENPMAAFDSNFAFGSDPNDSIRFELKLQLLATRHTEVTAETATPFGPKFVDFETLSANILQTLSGVDYNYPAVKQRLQDASKDYPYYKSVLNALDTTELVGKEDRRSKYMLDKIEQMQQQLVTYGAKDPGRHIALKVRQGDRGDFDTGFGSRAPRLYMYSSNNEGLEPFVTAQATSKMITHGFYQKKGDNYEIDLNVVNKFLGRLDAINEKDATHKVKARALSNLFQKNLGITIPVSVLNDSEMKGIELDLELGNEQATRSLLGKFRASLRGLNEVGADLEVNILTGLDSNNSGEKLFSLAAKYDRAFIQKTSRDVSGKSRYQHSAPKLITYALNQIKKVNSPKYEGPQLEESSVDTGNYIIESAKTLAGQEKLQIDYVDAIRDYESTEDGIAFHGMVDSDRNLMNLAMFMNTSETYVGQKQMWSRHLFPTLEAKKTMPVINLPTPKIQINTNMEAVYKDIRDLTLSDFISEKNFNAYYNKYLKNTVNVEISRINGIRALQGDTNQKEYTLNQLEATSFLLIPGLSAMLPNHSGILTPGEIAALHKQAKVILQADFTGDIQHILESLESVVLETSEKVGYGGTIESLSYLDPRKEGAERVAQHMGYDSKNIGTNEEAHAIFLGFVAKFVLADRAAKTNTTLMFIGDPGAFWKKDVGTTLDNMSKRFASMIAPGDAAPEVSWSEEQDDGSYKQKNNKNIRYLPLADSIGKKAAHFDYIKSLPFTKEEQDAYLEIEETDGAEWVTAEEHLSPMLAQGELSKREFTGLVKKAKNPNATFDKAELGWFNPTKWVTAGRVGGNLIYIKSARFPLVAKFTKGQEIDKLRVFMEENGFDSAAHDSAFKVGNTHDLSSTIYKEEGVIDVSNPGLVARKVTVPRGIFRKQQSVPVSKSSKKVHGSQPAKLVLANLAYEYIEGFSIPGQEDMNGAQLYDFYIKARQAELKLKVEQFGEKYGMNLTIVNGQARLMQTKKYKEALAVRMIEEAVSLKYTTNEIAHLHFDKEKGEFTSPLWSSKNADRVDALILSIFNKELLRPTIAGFAGPIRPEPGIAWADADAATKSSIIWVTKDGKNLFDGKRLQTQHVREDGTLQPDQIIMPWKFKGKLKDFTTKDPKTGKVTLDMSKVPAELLNVFAYRIPSQKKASSGSFEIVGFAPKEFGDTLIVPAELVGRIGQDYDIDKLFGMMYETRLNEDTGALEVLRPENAETIQEKIAAQRNFQVDVYHAAMRNPDPRVQYEVHQPVTDGYATELAKILSQGAEVSSALPMSIRYNNAKADSASSGQASIGVMASFDVAHAQLEQQPDPDMRGHFGTTMLGGKGVIHKYIVVNVSKTRKEAGKKLTAAQKVSNYISIPAETSRLGKKDILDTEFMFNQEGTLYPNYKPEGGTTQGQISRMVNHSVDDQNNHLLSKLGIHPDSWNMWTVGTSWGLNQETIGLIVNSPIVLEFYKKLRKGRGVGNTLPFSEKHKKSILLSMMEVELVNSKLGSVKALHQFINLNKETLMQQFLGTVETQDNHAHNVLLLGALLKAEEASKGFMAVQQNMKMDTRPPKTRGDFFELVLKNRFFQHFQEEGNNPLYHQMGLPPYNVIMGAPGYTSGPAWTTTRGNTVSGNVYETAENHHREVLILDGEHIENSVLVKTLGEALSMTEAMDSFGPVLNGIKSYLNAVWAEKLTGRTASELRAEYLDDTTNNIAVTVEEARRDHIEVRDNLFIKQLMPNTDIDKHGFFTLEFTGDRNLLVSSDQMQAAFLALVTSDNLEVRELAEKLLVYDLITGSTSRSYSKYIPAEYLQDMPDAKTGNARPDLNIRSQFNPNNTFFKFFSTAQRDVLAQVYRHDPKLAPKADIVEVTYQDHSDAKPVQKAGFAIEELKNEKFISKLGYVSGMGKLWKVTTQRTLITKEVEGVEVEVDAIIVTDEFAEDSVDKVGDYLSKQYTGEEGKGKTIERIREKKYYDPYDVEMDTSGDIENAVTGTSENTDSPYDDFEEYSGVSQDGDEGFLPLKEGSEEITPLTVLPIEQDRSEKGVIPVGDHVPLQGVIDQLFPNTTNFMLNWIIQLEESLPMENRIKVSPNAYSYTGSFNSQTRTLTYNRETITEVELAHEFVHAYTMDAIRNPSKYSKEVVDAVQEIHDLRKSIVESPELLEKMGITFSESQKFKRGYNIWVKANQEQILSADLEKAGFSESQIEDYKFYVNAGNQTRLQGLINTAEFMAEALSNPVFAKQLNAIELANDTTLLTRILKYVSGIMQELGVVPKGNTAANAVIANTVKAIQAVAKERGVSVKINKPKADVNDKDYQTEMPEDSTRDKSTFTPKDIETLKNYKRKRIRQFGEVKARFKDNPKLVKHVNQRLSLERLELNALDDSVTVETVVDFANRELDNVETLLAGKNVTGAQMGQLQSAIQDTFSVIEFYEHFRDRSGVNAQGRKELDTLQARARNLRSQYLTLSRSLLRSFAKNKFKGTGSEGLIDSNTFLEMENVDMLSANFLDASRQGRAEFSFLDQVIKEANAEQRQDFTSRMEAYRPLSEAYRETEYFKKHGWDGLVELDVDGNPTPRIITPLTGLWDRELEHHRKQAKENNDWKGYYKWLNANTGAVNVAQMYKVEDGVSIRTDNPAILRQLEKQFGALGAKELLARQDVLMQEYADTRVTAFYEIATNYMDREDQIREEVLWEKMNSPEAHYTYKTTKKWAPKGSRDKFLYHMPLRVKGNKPTGYYDSRFEDMQKEPAAVEYYNFVRGQFKEMMGMLPLHNINDTSGLLQNGLFLPAVRKEMELEFWDLKGKWVRLKDKFWDAITSSTQELESNLVDPVTGELRREISTRYLDKIKGNETQEYDMDKVFAEFTMMATTYNAKNKIEDVVNMTDEVLREVGIQHQDGMKDRITIKGIAQTSFSQDRRKNIMTTTKTLVDDFYGKKVKEPMIVGSKKARTTQDKETEANIKDKIGILHSLRKEGKLSTEEFNSKIDSLNEELAKVGGYIDISKLIRHVTQFMQLKGMGWNLPAATVNYVFGSMQVWRWAAGQEDFDETTTREAMFIMMGASLNSLSFNMATKSIPNASKIQGTMMTLNVLKDYTEVRWDATKAADPKEKQKWLDRVSPYHLQKTSEYFVYGLSTISHLKFVKVNGVSLWDSMDNDGIIQLEGYRPGEAEFNKLVAHLDQMNKAIHGNYDPDSPIAIKKTLLGPMLMQFRSWLPEGIAQRGQSMRYDTALEREVKGTFNTFGEHGMAAWSQLPKLLLPFMAKKMTVEGLSKVDEANVRKTAASIRQLMAVLLMVAILKGAIDDDDEDTAVLNYMLNIMGRVQNDLTFFHNPYSIQAMSKDALPVFKLARDLAKFGEAGMLTIMGDGTIPTGSYAGRYRMLHHGGKLIPFPGAVMKTARNFDIVQLQ